MKIKYKTTTEKSEKEFELMQAFKAGEFCANDKQKGLDPVEFDEWYKYYIPNHMIQSHENALKIIEDATKDRTTDSRPLTVE